MTKEENLPIKRNPWRRGIAGIAWTWVWLIIFYAGGFLCFVHYINSLLPPDPKVKTDAIVVLTGGVNRVQDGVQMLRDRQAPQLFISGVGGGGTVNSVLGLKKDDKSAPCCITLGHQARNTRENAQETAEWATHQNIHSLRLVTAAYHMPRAWLEFHAALPAAEILVCPAKPAAEGYEKINSATLAFLEYNKTILTFFRLYLWPVRSAS